jgi:hypothetical protein
VGRCPHLFVGQFAGGIDATLAGFHLGQGNVETDRAFLLAEFDHQGQTDVAQANNCNNQSSPLRHVALLKIAICEPVFASFFTRNSNRNF